MNIRDPLARYGTEGVILQNQDAPIEPGNVAVNGVLWKWNGHEYAAVGRKRQPPKE